MTTDAPLLPPVDDARLQALRARRSQPTERPTARHSRRRHPAKAARIVAGSLSASVALALMGVMARGQSPAPDPAPPAAVAAAPQRSVVVRRPSADGAVTSTLPPPVTAPVAGPVTSSQAS